MRFGTSWIALLVALALSAAACDGGSVTVNPPSDTSSATTPPAPTTTEPTPSPTASPPPTAAPISPLAPTQPEVVAIGLYQAWGADDRDLALAYAEAEAVDALFDEPFIPEAFFAGCSREGDVGYLCQFNAPSQAIMFHVLGSAANGYRVQSIEIGSAG
ncbi:MAG TPA: hypothetical protein VEO00_02130 [Actinomycetota bacterium]|nr:hypothetical protein [Actinomycetota bacterium]